MKPKSKYDQQMLRRVMNVKSSEREDYSRLVGTHLIQGEYLLVGDIATSAPWIIYVSSTWPTVNSLLKRVIPQLKALKVGFKVAKNLSSVRRILDGYSGDENIGKVITVYPKTNDDALMVAKRLIPATDGESGPRVPGANYLGGTVYTSTNGSKMSVWPFEEIRPREKVSAAGFIKNYRIVHPLKLDNKGRVLYAIKGQWMPPFYRKYVIKEARQAMFANIYTDDVQGRLRWQFELHKQLQDSLPIPRVFEIFEEHGNLYMVIEYISGALLRHIIHSTHAKTSRSGLPAKEKTKLFNLVISIITIIQKLHGLGYVHRDITPQNFLYTKGGEIYLIDLELCFRLQSKTTPYQGGTDGYRAPEDNAGAIPSVKCDVYAVGALAAKVLLNIELTKAGFTGEKRIAREFESKGISTNLAGLLSSSLSKIPAQRPGLDEIKAALNNELSILQTTREQS